MNIQTLIKPELWAAISKSYESGIYSVAILDSVHFLTDTIRDKSGLDGDGHSLVGQSFGGEAPKIRINKLQTQSEKDEQKGFSELLRGIYSFVRNPRSHDQIDDTRKSADTIIYFISYLISIIDDSKGPFVLEDWVNRVYDPDFVMMDRYIDILIQEVPPRRRSDAIINLYRGRSEASTENIRAVIDRFSMYSSENEVSEIIKVISTDLRAEREDNSIIQVMQCVPSFLWPKIDEDARLRIENKLIRSIKNGNDGIAYVRNGSGRLLSKKILDGVFGTWANDIVEHFTLCDELADAIYGLLRGSEAQNVYVSNYFLHHLPRISSYSTDKNMENLIINEIVNSINSTGFTNFKRSMTKNMHRLPESWRKRISSQTKMDLPEAINDEDIPF